MDSLSFVDLPYEHVEKVVKYMDYPTLRLMSKVYSLYPQYMALKSFINDFKILVDIGNRHSDTFYYMLLDNHRMVWDLLTPKNILYILTKGTKDAIQTIVQKYMYKRDCSTLPFEIMNASENTLESLVSAFTTSTIDVNDIITSSREDIYILLYTWIDYHTYDIIDNPELLQVLLDYVPHKSDILTIAIDTGKLNIVKMVIQNGISNTSNDNLIYYAITRKQKDIVEYLLSIYTVQDAQGLLRSAIVNNQLYCIPILVNKHNASIEKLDKNALLWICAHKGYLESAKLMLDHGADINHKKMWDSTPLDSNRYMEYKSYIVFVGSWCQCKDRNYSTNG